MAIEKIKILGAVLELPARQQCQSSQFTSKMGQMGWIVNTQCCLAGTVKLGNKERFDKEQIGIKELSMDYQPFYTINLLLDKEL